MFVSIGETEIGSLNSVSKYTFTQRKNKKIEDGQTDGITQTNYVKANQNVNI